jgi:hypothetical protein
MATQTIASGTEHGEDCQHVFSDRFLWISLDWFDHDNFAVHVSAEFKD